MFPMTAIIRAARPSDLDELVEMRSLLWPDGPREEHRRETETFLAGAPVCTTPHTVFVAESVALTAAPGSGESHPADEAVTGRNSATGPVLAAFLEVDLRSHADGCDPLHPVGFIEGWFVRETSRKRGIGGQLVRAAEDWARAQGCREMASDTWIDEQVSERAHQALGFEVVDRCIHFRKSL